VLAVLVAFCGSPAGFGGVAWRGTLVFGTAIYFGMPHFRGLLNNKPGAQAAPAPAAAAPVIAPAQATT